ncbi:MAG: archaeosine biosynthesis radical SAM protein RaSEA [Thermoplasmata archaeon]
MSRIPVPSVARQVATVRRPAPAPPEAASRFVNQWVEEEALDGTRVRAFVLILKTKGCYWADQKGCTMCGYSRDTLGRSATPHELAEQLRRALARYRGEPYVKIYTSGSFLDDREVDPASRDAIVDAFAPARRLLFETLPEFATEEALGPLRDRRTGTLEVALGLESTDPVVLRRFVQKSAAPAEYLAAADRIRRGGMRAKGYLLLKPPYLTEAEAVRDVVASIGEAAPHFDTLSVNPVHIQGGTVVEWLYHRGRYRPPWLWSVVDALALGWDRAGGCRLVSFPTAGGLPRGPHNCGRCDAAVLGAIRSASLDGRPEPLAEVSCACRAEYDRIRALEPLGVEA